MGESLFIEQSRFYGEVSEHTINEIWSTNSMISNRYKL